MLKKKVRELVGKKKKGSEKTHRVYGREDSFDIQYSEKRRAPSGLQLSTTLGAVGFVACPN